MRRQPKTLLPSFLISANPYKENPSVVLHVLHNRGARPTSHTQIQDPHPHPLPHHHPNTPYSGSVPVSSSMDSGPYPLCSGSSYPTVFEAA